MSQLSALSGPELVFGLVGAVGSDLKAVTRTLTSELERVRYKVEEIHVSSLLHQLDRYAHLGTDDFESEFERIREHMKAGTDLRNRTAAGEIMALLAISAIRQRRITLQPGLSEPDAAKRPIERTAFVIRSLNTRTKSRRSGTYTAERSMSSRPTRLDRTASTRWLRSSRNRGVRLIPIASGRLRKN